ncbi:hypothetical protein [Azonexus sp. IMCC34839]|uniref:capsular polysaccharide export protein, LipB/KpsS family n=1 Tax=Azonexus sp. IMCC34839 TaxID=3133695 RepID=UPI00399C3001
MMTTNTCFLISTLAEYQTEFWLSIGLELRAREVECQYLSFDDRSTEMLRAAGFAVYAFSEMREKAELSQGELDAIFKKYSVSDLNLWLSHERFTFGVRDSRRMQDKLARSLELANSACEELKSHARRVVLIQELGGFLSVIGAFFAARKNGVDNWFIEPSFFRGRMFFLKNTFGAPRIGGGKKPEVSAELRAYLTETLGSRAIVVPVKDRHHYNTAVRKIANMKNLRRLSAKLVDKYLLGKRQEFGHIFGHVKKHLTMLFNSLRLRHSYTSLAELDRFMYYPMHVPGDMALTIRSPEYLDQLALIDYLARVVPHNCKLAIKEHPAMIGAIDANAIRKLLRRHDNIALIPPSENNYEIMQKCEGVISVNSKSGAEAVLLGKPVLVLGDAFYRNAPLVTPINSLSEAGRCMHTFTDRCEIDKKRIEKFFQSVWDATFPGELYVTDRRNVNMFCDSMLDVKEEA